MTATAALRGELDRYLRDLRAASADYDGTVRHSAAMERLVGDYSGLVTDERHHPAWDALAAEGTAEFVALVADLRTAAARCAAIMEKYRALHLIAGRAETAGYFANVESCIEKEFGTFTLGPTATVLLVGSGSFPMTPLYIARRTGARVVGVDIDPEAVDLGGRVLAALSGGLDIRLEAVSAEDSASVGEATHVIFSSTVAVKYELLHRLHPLTRADVVVAMRYGDHLKSLFNYPMLEVDPGKWRLVETVLRPAHVFDVALYQKV